MNPAIHIYSCYLANEQLIWISSDILFSIGISSHLEDKFTVRRSDDEYNRKFLPACFTSCVQHRLNESCGSSIFPSYFILIFSSRGGREGKGSLLLSRRNTVQSPLFYSLIGNMRKELRGNWTPLQTEAGGRGQLGGRKKRGCNNH